MDDLTPEELGFIRKRLKISADDIVDGRGISFDEATCEAERHNKRVILFQCCSKHANHRISNKHRRCLQCNPEYFAFANRKQSRGFVYIAASKSERLIKIGFTADPIERTKTLNYGYGSAEDWKILFWIEIERAGEIEKSAQDQLMRFRLDRTYEKGGGKKQKAGELYENCSFDIAARAIANALNGREPIKYKQEKDANSFDFRK